MTLLQIVHIARVSKICNHAILWLCKIFGKMWKFLTKECKAGKTGTYFMYLSQSDTVIFFSFTCFYVIFNACFCAKFSISAFWLRKRLHFEKVCIWLNHLQVLHGYRNLQRFTAGESVTPRGGSTQQTVLNLDQWSANIMKWTRTNIEIYSDATLCTSQGLPGPNTGHKHFTRSLMCWEWTPGDS